MSERLPYLSILSAKWRRIGQMKIINGRCQTARVRSLNSATAAGAKIGRAYPDVWVSDELLRRTTNSLIEPQISLSKSVERKRAEQFESGLSSFIAIALMCVIAFVLTAIPNAILPLPSYLGHLAWVFVAVFALSLGCMVLFFGLSRDAKAMAVRAESAASRALLDAAFDGALQALTKRRLKEGMLLPRNQHRDVSAPDKMPSGVTPRGAEQLVAQWMRHLGEVRAEATHFQSDGGIDVAGEWFIAQVKHFNASVGVAPIREIAGVSNIDRRRPLFFTSTGYSVGAIEFANKSGVALFVYSAERAELRGINELAKALMTRGLGDPYA